MQCRECKHISQDVSPKFCSQCGGSFATSAAHASVDTKFSLTPEIDLGSIGGANIDAPRELRADLPFSAEEVHSNLPPGKSPVAVSPKTTGLSIQVPSQSSCPNTQVQKKKKNRKRKKKKFHSKLAESESLKSINSSEEVSMDIDVLMENQSVHSNSLTDLESEADSLLCKELRSDQQNVNVENEHGEMGDKLTPKSEMHINSLSDPAKTDPDSPVEQPILLNPPLPLPLSPDNSVLIDGNYEKMNVKRGSAMKEESVVLVAESSTGEKGNGAGDQSSLLAQKERDNLGCHPTAGSSHIPMSIEQVADVRDAQKQNCSPENLPSTQLVEKEMSPECIQIVSIIENIDSSETSSAIAIPDSPEVTEMLKAGENSNKGKTGSKDDHVKDSKTKAGLDKAAQLHTRKEKEMHPEDGKEKGSPQPDPMEKKKQPNRLNQEVTKLDTSTNPGNAERAQNDTSKEKTQPGSGKGKDKVLQADSGKEKTQPSSGKGKDKVLQADSGKVQQGDLPNEKGDTSATGKSGESNNDQSNSRQKKLAKENAEKKKENPAKSEKGTEDQASSEKTNGVKRKDQVSQKRAPDFEVN